MSPSINTGIVSPPLRLLHVVASINVETGGPAVSVTRLADLLAGAGQDVTVATLGYRRHGPIAPLGRARLCTVEADAFARIGRGWSPALGRLLREAAGGADLVHSHGLWMFPNREARRAAVARRLPLVISPRGMLEAWSLRRSRWKKRVAGLLFERRNLASATAFHATSLEEARSIRSFGLSQPIAVIPNGVDLPGPESRGDRAVLESRFPELRGRRWALFLSRLHPKKGVTELLDAWAAVAARADDWHLVVAGPGEAAYREILRRRISQAAVPRVTLTGPLTGADKESAFAGAGLFVLPTHSENFGLVIAEALGREVPVLTTRAAPWGGIVPQECGWWIHLEPELLATTLRSAMSLTDEARHRMGQRGRRWVEARYGWENAAREMGEFYRWLVRRAERPSSVQWADVPTDSTP